MIPNHLAIIPLNKMHHATVQALATPADRRKGDYPLAGVFFKVLLGYRRPKADDLIRHFNRPLNIRGREGLSVDAYMRAIDFMLATNGERCPLPLNDDVRRSMFPEKLLSNESRDHNRLVMFHQRDDNIKLKRQKAKNAELQDQADKFMAELQAVSASEGINLLETWSHEEVADTVLRPVCKYFFALHKPILSDWSFYDLYDGYTTSRVILDLKLTIRANQNQ